MSWETSKYFFYLGRELLSFFPNFAFFVFKLGGACEGLETQIKTEEKIGKDIPFVKLQLADNQLRPTPLKMFIFWDLSSNPGSVSFSDPETVGGRGDV